MPMEGIEQNTIAMTLYQKLFFIADKWIFKRNFITHSLEELYAINIFVFLCNMSVAVWYIILFLRYIHI